MLAFQPIRHLVSELGALFGVRSRSAASRPPPVAGEYSGIAVLIDKTD
jgi:hypothetical protein